MQLRNDAKLLSMHCSLSFSFSKDPKCKGVSEILNMQNTCRTGEDSRTRSGQLCNERLDFIFTGTAQSCVLFTLLYLHRQEAVIFIARLIRLTTETLSSETNGCRQASRIYYDSLMFTAQFILFLSRISTHKKMSVSYSEHKTSFIRRQTSNNAHWRHCL